MIKQQSLVLAAALGAALFATAAQAGQCPADEMRADATKPATNPAKGVTDSVLSAIDLSKEPAAIDGRKLRLRKLVVQPGGVVPWHSHADRPAIIYIVDGTIIEYASNCAVPIVHKTGEVARETSATSHWWKNRSHSPVILLSADVQHDESDHNI